MLFDQEIIRGHGHDPSTTLSPAVMDALSVANWGTYQSLQQHNETRHAAQNHNVWLADFADPAITGLAKMAKNSALTGDALWQFLRENIFKQVMLHELNHTLGLRHNLGASADALNYADAYWPLRIQTNPEGVDLVRVDPAELGTVGLVENILHMNCSTIDNTNQSTCTDQQNNSMYEYQYSSVMDYAANFNSHRHGLGKYDIAALAALYGDIIEVFDPDVIASLPDASFANDLRNAASIRNPLAGSLTQTLHYARLPAMFGGHKNIAKRKWVAREDYDPQGTQIRVPYLTCSDEYQDTTPLCHRWDQGADSYEIVNHLANSYREYYVFHNFQRERLGFQPASVFSQVATRYFFPMTNMYQHWFSDAASGIKHDAYWSQSAILSVELAFTTLYNVLATPRYGSYKQINDIFAGEVYRWQTYGIAEDRDHIVAPGEGKRYLSRYDTQTNYEIAGQVLEVGSFYEQLAALLALTTNDAAVLAAGRDQIINSKRYSIPWSLAKGKQINDLFSAIVREDFRVYAPRVNEGELLFFDALRRNDPSEFPGIPIEMGFDFSTKALTLFYGMANLSVNNDLSFVQRGQVAIVGSGETHTPASGFEAVTIDNPFSGQTYIAYRPEAPRNQSWMAADYIEDIRQISDFFTTFECQPFDCRAKNAPQCCALEQRFKAKIEILELMRSMAKLYESL